MDTSGKHPSADSHDRLILSRKTEMITKGRSRRALHDAQQRVLAMFDPARSILRRT